MLPSKIERMYIPSFLKTMSDIPPGIPFAKIISSFLSPSSYTRSFKLFSRKMKPSLLEFKLNLYILPVLKSPTNTWSLYFSKLCPWGNSIAVIPIGT